MNTDIAESYVENTNTTRQYIQPIQTFWSGYHFRSRVEARWAVAFDHLSIQYNYELEGYRLNHTTFYLPDFYLPQVRMWAEVKPTSPTAGERAKCDALVRGTGHGCLFLVGPPDFTTYEGLTLDCGEITTAQYLLDPDLHGRKYLDREHRFFSDPGAMEKDDFSPQYQIAVYASRAERFENHGVPRLGHEVFNATPAELKDAWGSAR